MSGAGDSPFRHFGDIAGDKETKPYLLASQSRPIVNPGTSDLDYSAAAMSNPKAVAQRNFSRNVQPSSPSSAAAASAPAPAVSPSASAPSLASPAVPSSNQMQTVSPLPFVSVSALSSAPASVFSLKATGGAVDTSRLLGDSGISATTAAAIAASSSAVSGAVVPLQQYLQLKAEKEKIEQTLRDIEQVRSLEYTRMKEIVHKELNDVKTMEEQIKSNSQVLQQLQARHETAVREHTRITNSAILSFSSRIKELEMQVQRSKNDKQKLIEELEKVKQEKNQIVNELSQLRSEFYKSVKEKDEMLEELAAIKRQVASMLQ